jgi:hypothetical protein
MHAPAYRTPPPDPPARRQEIAVWTPPLDVVPRTGPNSSTVRADRGILCREEAAVARSSLRPTFVTTRAIKPPHVVETNNRLTD